MNDTTILKKMKANDELSAAEQTYLHANIDKFTELCEISGVDISPYLQEGDIEPISITKYQQQCSSIFDEAKENKSGTTKTIFVKGFFQEYRRTTPRGSPVKRHYVTIADGYTSEGIEVDITIAGIVGSLSELEKSLYPEHVILKIVVRVHKYNDNWCCRQLCTSINVYPAESLNLTEPNEILNRAPWLAGIVGERKGATFVVLDSYRELLSKITKVTESSSLSQCVDAQSPDKLIWIKRRQYTWLAGPALLTPSLYIRPKQGASLPLLTDLATGCLSTDFGKIKPDIAWVILSSRPEQLKHADAFILPDDIGSDEDLRVLLEGRLDKFSIEQKVWMCISLQRKEIEERTKKTLPELYECFKGYPPSIQTALVTASGFDAEVVADYVYLVSTANGDKSAPIALESINEISDKSRELLLKNELLCEIEGGWYLIPPGDNK